jgi:hypothetical protein
MNKKNFLVLFLIGQTLFVSGQSFYAVRRERSLMAIIGTGNSSYYGEIKDAKEYLDPRLNINVGLQYFVTPRISTRVELTYFQLHGTDVNSSDGGRAGRNLSFTANNFELNASGAINLFPLGQRFYQRPPINAYAFVGVGLMYNNPTAKLDGKKYALQPLQTEDVKYSRFQFVVPYGLGARLKVNPFFNIAVEGGYRLTFTDYLDDVSHVHPDKSSWDPNSIRFKLSDRRPELGKDPYLAGAQRGNPGSNDGYFLLNVKVEYYLPKNFLFNDTQRRYYNQKRKLMHKRKRK